MKIFRYRDFLPTTTMVYDAAAVAAAAVAAAGENQLTRVKRGKFPWGFQQQSNLSSQPI